MWKKYWRIVSLGMVAIISAIIMALALPFALLGGLAWMCGIRVKDRAKTKLLAKQETTFGTVPPEGVNLTMVDDDNYIKTEDNDFGLRGHSFGGKN